MAKQPTKLPDLVWKTIFKFLEYDDLLNLKKIFVELKDLVPLYVESRRVVINQGNESFGQSYFSNEYLVSKSLIRFRLNSDMHLAIKRLVLYNPLRFYHLKSFDNLTSLNIESYTIFKGPNRIMISLKNLVDFEALISDNDGEFTFVLETPKLAKFFVNFDLDQLQILHPRSVKTAYSPTLDESVKQMVNLETLETFHYGIHDIHNLFGDLKRLKKFVFFEREENLNVINEHFRFVQLANPNLKIFYKEIDINANPMQDTQLTRTSDRYLDDESLVIYQKYVDACDENLNHGELRIEDFQNLSVELVRKLGLLKDLQVLGEITDDEKWRELLKRPHLNRLTIRSSVKEEQLNMIPEHCPFANFVQITSFDGGDWLLRLKYLQELKTDVLFDFELLKKLIRQNCYLKLIKVSASYRINIENGVVECTTKGEIVLREPRPVFLQTINLVDVWSDLFHSEF